LKARLSLKREFCLRWVIFTLPVTIDVGHAISDRAKALIKLAVDGFDLTTYQF
jgi:hypothetical protein